MSILDNLDLNEPIHVIASVQDDGRVKLWGAFTDEVVAISAGAAIPGADMHDVNLKGYRYAARGVTMRPKFVSGFVSNHTICALTEDGELWSFEPIGKKWSRFAESPPEPEGVEMFDKPA